MCIRDSCRHPRSRVRHGRGSHAAGQGTRVASAQGPEPYAEDGVRSSLVPVYGCGALTATESTSLGASRSVISPVAGSMVPTIFSVDRSVLDGAGPSLSL